MLYYVNQQSEDNVLLLIQKVPALIFKHQLEPQNVKKRKRQSIGV